MTANRPNGWPLAAAHISTVNIQTGGNCPPVYELDGLCHCPPWFQGESSSIGMCRRCFRLDKAKATP